MKQLLSFLLAAFCLAAWAPQQSVAQTQTWPSGSSPSNPNIITTEAQLAQLAIDVNIYGFSYAGEFFRLDANLNLGVAPYNTNAGWIPIGTRSDPFSGRFDGNGKTITGLFINDAGLVDEAGLFGVVDGDTVKNLRLEGVAIIARYHVGGVAGYVDNGGITKCYVTGTVSGVEGVGGVAGYVVGAGSVTSSHADVAVTGVQSVGGVAGYVELFSVVTSSYATGTVTGTNRVGGVAGLVDNSAVTSSYAVGAVSGANHVGGVAGAVDNSAVTDCAALNPSVTATNSDVGRVAGSSSNGGSLFNNIAWDGISDGGGASFSGLNTHDDLGGASVTAAYIHMNATLEGRFLTPWVTEAGKLPSFITATPMPVHLRMPSAPLALTVTADGTQARLAWTTPTFNGGSPITHYQFAYGTATNPTNWQLISGSSAATIAYTLANLSNNTTYYVRVRAVNRFANGAASNEATLTISGFALTVTSGPDGKVTGTPSSYYAAGTPVDLTAVPDNGYQFVGWTIVGVTLPATAANPIAFSMPANAVTLTAHFERRPSSSIMRMVTLKLPADITSLPTAGISYIPSGSDFVFTLTLPSGQVPTVKTNREIQGVPEVLTALPNDDGTYTFTVRQVRQMLEITVTNSVGNAEVSASQVWSHGGKVYVHTAKSSTLYIYSLAGQLYKQQSVDAGETVIELPQGFYIVVMDGKRWKVVAP